MVIKVDEKTRFSALNETIRNSKDKTVVLDGCIGQRYIAAGLADKEVVINGIPGNALAAYLDGGIVTVHGNAQDATGDTMNAGKIIVYGNAGDATGYAMRGGAIYVRGNTGYRAGVHMKEYKSQKPVLVIGGRAGSFLGEYQAGGIIVVLGMHGDGKPILGNFCGTGMHGGAIYVRAEQLAARIPERVKVKICGGEDKEKIAGIIEDYAACFGLDAKKILADKFYMLTPDSANPYKQLYTQN